MNSKGGASAWWHSLSVQRFKENQPPIRKWESMRILMETKFLPKDWRQQLFLKLQNCRQGARSIEAYVTEFYTLLARNEIQESPAQLIARFIGGLNFPIKSQMLVATHTMEDTIEMACRIESNLRHPSYTNKSNTRYYHQSSTSDNHQLPSQPHHTTQLYPASNSSLRSRPNFRSPYPNTSSSHSSIPISSSYAQPQVPAQQSSSNPTNQARPPKSTNDYARYRGDKYYRCLETGHYANECPKHRGINAYVGPAEFTGDEEPSYDDYQHEHTEEENGYELHEVEGEPLVAICRPLFLTKPTLSQRHNIFQSKCFIGGKVCDIIIDGGSSENIISAKAVAALKLPVTPHPVLYSIGWIQKEYSTRVTKQCEVTFSVFYWVDTERVFYKGY
ncbi:uncharacterized protein A4U43_C04F6150 [Asparagus officinalis]|uniref:Retrotransposon gag domain-containing protein n=1 Tax=Asparagus officinalis TaxID=4686 RepID=A0A5P1F0H1_ASPOF|nr:uncharacterized protein A4U43_C04F6150 [Asparagus officinalis]